jgi:hypothetical protein
MTVLRTARHIQLNEGSLAAKGLFNLTNETQSSDWFGEETKDRFLRLSYDDFWSQAREFIIEANVEEEVDLFAEWETLPQNIQDLIQRLEDRLEESGNGYLILADMLQEFEAEGYTFDYGLDAEPFMLKKL